MAKPSSRHSTPRWRAMSSSTPRPTMRSRTCSMPALGGAEGRDLPAVIAVPHIIVVENVAEPSSGWRPEAAAAPDHRPSGCRACPARRIGVRACAQHGVDGIEAADGGELGLAALRSLVVEVDGEREHLPAPHEAGGLHHILRRSHSSACRCDRPGPICPSSSACRRQPSMSFMVTGLPLVFCALMGGRSFLGSFLMRRGLSAAGARNRAAGRSRDAGRAEAGDQERNELGEGGALVAGVAGIGQAADAAAIGHGVNHGPQQEMEAPRDIAGACSGSAA